MEGETFEAESGWCTFVGVEDDYRVYAEFHEGDAMFNAPASADGVKGERSAYVAQSGTEYVPIEVDITCIYD